jgi:DNA repair protein RecO (recombination protein O)
MSAKRAQLSAAAYLLHRYDWSETSLILDLFTREHGRVAVAAKGAKRPYSQLRSVLLPFQRIHANFSAPPSDGSDAVQTLRSADWAGGAPMLSGAALFSGFYLNELLLKLLARQDPHPRVFDAYAATLPALSAQDDTLTQAALRAFEVVLLREIGLLPQLDAVTATQAPVLPGHAYQLRPEIGIVDWSHAESALSGQQLLGLQRALDGGRLADLQVQCAQSLAALRFSLRSLLHYHLGTSQLKTRAVMVDAQQLFEPVHESTGRP